MAHSHGPGLKTHGDRTSMLGLMGDVEDAEQPTRLSEDERTGEYLVRLAAVTVVSITTIAMGYCIVSGYYMWPDPSAIRGTDFAAKPSTTLDSIQSLE